MKKTLLYLFFLIPFSCQAQDSWNTTIMNSGTCPDCLYRKMIKTNDGGFVVLLWGAANGNGFIKDQHRLLKYDSIGQLLWDKGYDFGVSQPASNERGGGVPKNNLLELNNGDLIGTGKYTDADTSYTYFFRTNSEGDSLVFNGYDLSGNFFGRIMLDQDEIYGISAVSNTILLLHLNDNGEIQTSTTLDESNSLHYSMSSGTLFTSRSFSETIFRKFSLNGDLQTSFSFDGYYGQLIVPNNDGGVTGYYRGLIKLDANLEEVWHTPIEDLFVGLGSLDYAGFAITATPDGGYVLGGHASAYTPNDALVYLVKVDANGIREWGGLYGQQDIGLNYIFDVEPVVGGYVFTGASLTTELMWLAKVNSEGIYVASEELVFQEQEVTVFPNPASEVVNLRWPDFASGALNLYGPSGQLLKTYQVSNQKEYILLIHDLVPGIYTAHLMDEKRKGLAFRFVKC